MFWISPKVKCWVQSQLSMNFCNIDGLAPIKTHISADGYYRVAFVSCRINGEIMTENVAYVETHTKDHENMKQGENSPMRIEISHVATILRMTSLIYTWELRHITKVGRCWTKSNVYLYLQWFWEEWKGLFVFAWAFWSKIIWFQWQRHPFP